MARVQLCVLLISFVNLVSYAKQQCPDYCICDSDKIKCVFAHSKLSSLEVPQDINHLEYFNMSAKPINDLLRLNKPQFKQLIILKLTQCKLTTLPFFNKNFPSLLELDVSKNEIYYFPDTLPSSLHILNIGYNYIVELKSKSLVKLTNLLELSIQHNKLEDLSLTDLRKGEILFLPKLEKINLSFNQIKTMSNTLFTGLINLKWVSLSGNKLKEISSQHFPYLHALEHLDLCNNVISSIATDAFSKLHNLKYLTLSNNQLSSLPEQIPMVEWFDVSYNNIRHIPNTFTSVIFPIEFFNIGHNPFHCDCDILWLKQIYDRREYILKHLDINPLEFIPGCSGPDRLAGKLWNELADEDFVCKPLMMDNKQSVDLGSFSPEHLQVRIVTKSDHIIQIEWKVSLNVVSQNTLFIHYYQFGHKETSLKYIEVAASQREFTLKHLQPETNYIVCVIPKLDQNQELTKVVPVSLNHCLEVTTLQVQLENLDSNFKIMFYYILGMTGALMFTFAVVGLCLMSGDRFIPKGTWQQGDAADVDQPTEDTEEKEEAFDLYFQRSRSEKMKNIKLIGTKLAKESLHEAKGEETVLGFQKRLNISKSEKHKSGTPENSYLNKTSSKKDD